MSRRRPRKRKNTRKEISLSESTDLATIGEHLPYHIYLKDRQRRFVWANPAMLKSCGCTLQQLKGRRDEDFFENPHLKQARRDDKRVIEKSAKIIDKLEFETWKRRTIVDSGGQQVTVRRLCLVLTTKRPFYKDGEIVGILGVTRDYAAELPSFLKKSDYPWDLNHLSSGVYYRNLRTNEQWTDDIFRELFPEQKIKDRWLNVHEEDRDRVRNCLQRLTKSRRKHRKKRTDDAPVTASVDFRVTVNGKLCWVRGSAIVFRSGEDWTLLVGHQDISEEKQREALSARALLSLPEHVYVFVKDPQKRFRFINASFSKALGWHLREVINKTDDDLGFPKEQIEVFAKHDDAILQGKSKGPEISIGERVRTKHGKVLTLLTMKMPLDSKVFDPGWSASRDDANSTAQHILGIAWDMDQYEPKEKEAILRSQTAYSAWIGLLNGSSDAIFLKTTDGKYLAVNDTYAHAVGKTRSEIIGKKTEEVFGDQPELLETILTEDGKLIGKETTYTAALRERNSPDGKKSYISSMKLAILDGAGTVQYILGLSRDITAFLAQQR